MTLVRRGAKGAWTADRRPGFENLDHDIDDVYATYKKSPVVIVQAVDPQGEPIPTARPRVDYPRDILGVPDARRWESGIDGQAMFGLQPDGRWRSAGLIPDQLFTLTVQAPGHRAKSTVLKLDPGKVEEVKLELEPAPLGESTIGLEPEPEGEPLFRLEVDFGPMEDESVGKTPQAGDGAAASEDRETEDFRLVWDEGPMEEETAKTDANVAAPPRSITRPEDLPPKGYTAYDPSDASSAQSPTTLVGVVTDDQGQPLPGVKVDAWHWFAGNETTTDSNGRFELRGFEPHESLEIVFTKEGLSPLLRTGVKAGTLLEVTLDDKTSVVGTIRDPAGQPVVGAVVRASHEVRLEDGNGVPLHFETKTDAEGHYRLLVARGNFDLWARKPGVGIAQRAFVLADPGRPETVDLQLEPGVRFEARLRDSLTGKPVVEAKLESQFADVQGVSDENGLVLLDVLPHVELVIAVKAPGYARWWSPQSSIKPDHGNPEKAGQWQDDTGHLRFELSAARLNAEIELEPAVTLRGRVVDPNGAPVAGAALAANLTGQTGAVSDTRFKTDAGGRFELHLPASGAVEYNLVAHDGDWRTSRNWANGYGEPLRTAPGQTLEGIELRLTKGATIRGRVVDRQGRPVAGKAVVAKANHPRANRYFQPRATTDAEGRFELRNVEGGSNYVMVEQYWVPEDGPAGSWRRIEVTPGEDVDDVELIAKPEPAASGPFFRVGQGYVTELDSVDGRIERAAEAFQPGAQPLWDGQPRLIWDRLPIAPN
jgi:protocatechuate 3,4-dioxygenase beta subunit